MTFKNIIWSPLDYATAAVLAREAGQDLLSRLEWMTLKPKIVVDMGCGIGEMSAPLQMRYPEAQVISLDASESMLLHAKAKQFSSGCVCADAALLPLPAQSVDLIVAHFLLPWHVSPPLLLQEWRRVLRPGGLLMLTALGPDTLREWEAHLPAQELPQRVDMHEVGDWLLQEGFADPVLDVNHYTLSDKEKTRFFRELQATGMWLPAHPSEAESFIASIECPINETFNALYEVIYGHAFIPEQEDHFSASSDGTVRVPLSKLRQQLKLKD